MGMLTNTWVDKDAGKYFPVVGRILIALIFIIVGFAKITGFSGTVAYVGAAGVPLPEVATIIAIILEFGGGVMLLLGYRTRLASLMLIAFTVLTIVFFHMDLSDPMQQTMLLKNLAIIGGLLYTAKYGSGMWSVKQDR